jgi:hypothetical protein
VQISIYEDYVDEFGLPYIDYLLYRKRREGVNKPKLYMFKTGIRRIIQLNRVVGKTLNGNISDILAEVQETVEK